ncbi:MAG: hypothetical protein EXS09_02600 [Gemmataceae bacterium]|nr:hypothetical protein [Gemmataceae bacterium]
MHQAVDRRMLADVPIGVLLSGGLDSSTIASLIARSNYGPFQTFSIGFEEASFDETERAAEVARIVGSEHFARTFTASEFVRQVPILSASLDEPFADPSIYPTAVLCELAAEHVKVAMGGDGADEVFAGYGTFAALKAARWYERLVPGFVHRNLVQPLTRMLSDSDKYLPLSFKVARFLRGTHVPEAIRTARWMAPFSPELLRELTPDLRELQTDEEAFISVANAIDRSLEFFQRTYLPNDILVKMDRASMMHSLEVRSPFLDTALVTYVNSLPSNFKFRKGVQKHILREAVVRGKLLPENIVRRRKQGFAMPVARWMRVELQSYFREVVIDAWPPTLDMFDRRVIQRLWNEHTNRVENRYKELWALFALAQWENFRDRYSATESSDVLPFQTQMLRRTA